MLSGRCGLIDMVLLIVARHPGKRLCVTPPPQLKNIFIEVQLTYITFLDSKITADVYCSHEMKRHLLLGRKAMTNMHSILRNRNITLPTKVYRVKAMVFPVVMYECESWTIKLSAKELMLLNCGVGEDS